MKNLKELEGKDIIYLVETKNYCKIGFTTNLWKRFKQYCTHNPDINLVAFRNGNKKAEDLFHILLQRYLINKTEWMKKDKFIYDCFRKLILPHEYASNIQDVHLITLINRNNIIKE